MKHRANIDFVTFRDKVLPQMSGSACDVRREIGSALRGIPRFPNGKALIYSSEWEDWLHEVDLPRDRSEEYEWLGKNGKPRDISNFVSKLAKRGSGSKFLAAALYYRLHYHVEKLDFAWRVDEAAFGEGKKFDAFNDDKPVFEAKPELIMSSAPFSYPPYKFEDDVNRLLARRSDDGIWLDPHNHHSIPMFPRPDAEARLTKFMNSGRSLGICPVIGPSGAGKTRLISEWMRPYVPTVSDTSWDAGFVVSDNPKARDPKPWRRWKINRDTLIVIDYTYAFGEVVKAIVEKAREQDEYSVRLIVIDHIMPKFLHDDFFWGELGGGHPSTLDSIRTLVVPAIEIECEKDDSALLKHVIAKSASVGGGDYSGKEPVIIEALSQLDRMGREQGDLDAVRHPLFAALMGQVIRESNGKVPDFSAWSRRDLVTYYFRGKDRLPWTGWDCVDGEVDKSKEGLSVGAVVAAATLRRGLCINDVAKFLPKNHKIVVQWAKRIASSNSRSRIEPLVPDVLGEAFFLKFIKQIEWDDDFWEFFIEILSTFKTKEQEESSVLSCTETIQRLVRNLLNENQQTVDTQDDWRLLTIFLDPARFPEHSQIRYAITISLCDTIKQMRRARRLNLMPQFADQIISADLVAACEGKLWKHASHAYIQYFDYIVTNTNHVESILSEFYQIISKYRNNSSDLWPISKMITYEECLNTAMFTHQIFDGDSEASTPEFWTRSELAAIKSDRRVAIVGSGPAGLAAAWRLSFSGHNVDVFEKDAKLGGLLRYGIPDFKIDRRFIDRQVQQMEKDGVVFHRNTAVGASVSATELIGNYDAFILAGGTGTPRDLPIAGRRQSGIYFAMEFLARQNQQSNDETIDVCGGVHAIDKRVVVIGNDAGTAEECIRSALCQNAVSVVHILNVTHLPSEESVLQNWPNWPMELGNRFSYDGRVSRMFDVMANGFVGRSGHVTGVDCVKVDESYCPVPGCEFLLDADLVLLAMGFVHPIHQGMLQELGVEFDCDGNVTASTRDYRTSQHKVFACGDMRSGQSLVVRAIHDGRQAALSVEKFIV